MPGNEAHALARRDAGDRALADADASESGAKRLDLPARGTEHSQAVVEASKRLVRELCHRVAHLKAGAVVREPHDGSDVTERDAEIPQPSRQAQGGDMAFAVVTVAVGSPARRGDDPLTLVEADGVRWQTTRRRRLLGVHDLTPELLQPLGSIVGGAGVRVELLWFEGCPNHVEARRALDGVLAARGLVRTQIESVRVDESTVEALRFPGSPTIRIDGRDIEPGFRDPGVYALSCRVYETPSGLRGTPPADWIERAVDEAIKRGRSAAAVGPAIIDELRGEFNAARGRVRVITFLSPT